MVENANSRENQLKKLQNLENRGIKTSNKIDFQDLVVCHVGVPVKVHHPNTGEKDAQGRNIKDENRTDGYLYTFSQFGTANKVMAVLSKNYKLDLLTAYKLRGKGYQMRNANMIYIDENCVIEQY